MTWACPGYASGMSEAMNLNTCIKAILRGMPRHAQVCPRHTPSNNLKYMYKYHFEGHALGLPGAWISLMAASIILCEMMKKTLRWWKTLRRWKNFETMKKLWEDEKTLRRWKNSETMKKLWDDEKLLNLFQSVCLTLTTKLWRCNGGKGWQVGGRGWEMGGSG